jgi:glycosyltransferase involved in cell wall biosynthesis
MPPQPTNLSLALIARNEKRCLARCLASVREVVDQIVVVDTGSTDDTVGIAERFGAKISRFTWTDDFSAARNFALEQTTGNWILVLDADEQVSPELGTEIRKFVSCQTAVGRLRIVSDFRRNNQVFRSQSFVSRLFPRGAHFEGRIHEQLISPLPRLNLQGEVWHDGYLQTTKSDRNVTLLRRELQACPDDPYLLFQLSLEYTSLGNTVQASLCLERAFAKLTLSEPFAPNAVVEYLYALSELKEFDRGIAVIGRASATVDDFPDFHLACGLFYMNLVRSDSAKYISYLPNIERSFKRALSLGESQKYKSVTGAGSFLAHYNLGTLYHVFGDKAGASRCFEQAAALGYEPAKQMLQRV